jgi:SAM-dependent methyltransferase
MGFARNLLLRTFGRPRGFLGRLGGLIMARSNRACAEWAIGLLEVGPQDRVLEVGFGPGVAIELLARVPARRVVGVDPSTQMLEQAAMRNAAGVASGPRRAATGLGGALALRRRDLRQGARDQLHAGLAGRGRGLARAAPGPGAQRADPAGFHALFRTAQDRGGGDARGGPVRKGAPRRVGDDILRARDEAMT